jgi:hypothetical protein
VINKGNRVFLTWWWFGITVRERVSRIAVGTSAHGRVVYDRALRAKTARPGTRIAALFTHASLVTAAFGIYRAFGTAVRGTSYVRGQARARGRSAYISTLRVQTARGGNARISVGLLLRRGLGS